jgi:hypothetical protein
MGAFAEMFPGRKPEQQARDEQPDGQDPPFRFLDGPLDLASGVVHIQRRRDARPGGPGEAPPGPSDVDQPDPAERD